MLLVLGIVGGGVVYPEYRKMVQRNDFEDGDRAYQRGDCAVALPPLQRAAEPGRDAALGRQARAKADACVELELVALKTKQKPDAKVAAYLSYLEKADQAPLTKRATTDLRSLWGSVPMKTLATAKLCGRLDELRAHAWKGASASKSPEAKFLMACGGTWEKEKKYTDAAILYKYVAEKFPKSPLAEPASIRLYKANISAAQRSGSLRNLAPPRLVATDSRLGSKAVFILVNGTRDDLSFIFGGPDTSHAALAACEKCVNAKADIRQCADDDPTEEVSLTAGRYHVLKGEMTDLIPPSYGVWDLQAGGIYRSCWYATI